MKTQKTVTIFFGLALLLGFLAPVTWGSQRDQATQLTFSQPVQIPDNIVLPPGTYWFAIADSSANRNIVRVFDANWNPISTTLANSTQQLQPSENTQLTFAERSADQPEVLLKWFYPGDTLGHEFVYSGSEGRALSEQTVDVVTVIADPAPMIAAFLLLFRTGRCRAHLIT
jgi:hypothetical protein